MLIYGLLIEKAQKHQLTVSLLVLKCLNECRITWSGKHKKVRRILSEGRLPPEIPNEHINVVCF